MLFHLFRLLSRSLSDATCGSCSRALSLSLYFFITLFVHTVIKAFALHLNFCTFGAHLSKNAPKFYGILFILLMANFFIYLLLHLRFIELTFCCSFVLGNLLHFFDHRQMSSSNNNCSNYQTGLAHRKWSNKLTFTWNCFCIHTNCLA